MLNNELSRQSADLCSMRASLPRSSWDVAKSCAVAHQRCTGQGQVPCTKSHAMRAGCLPCSLRLRLRAACLWWHWTRPRPRYLCRGWRCTWQSRAARPHSCCPAQTWRCGRRGVQGGDARAAAGGQPRGAVASASRLHATAERFRMHFASSGMSCCSSRPACTHGCPDTSTCKYAQADRM